MNRIVTSTQDKSHPSPPVIVLAGHTSALGVIRALGKFEVPMVLVSHDKHDVGLKSRFVEEKILAPDPIENENEFINLLVECGRRLAGSFLVPTADSVLVAVSRHKDLLQRYYTVGCSNWEIVSQFIDKHNTFKLASKVGVPMPFTAELSSEEDVEACKTRFQYPCLLKPRQSHIFYREFQTKLLQVNSDAELEHAYRAAAKAGISVTLQELIPGPAEHGANYICYFCDGEPVVEFTAKKVRNYPPAFGSPCVTVSDHIEEILEPGRRILRSVNYEGFACIELVQDERDSLYKLIEVNARHNLSSLLAVRCGINFPWLEYRHRMFGEHPSAVDYRKGIFWIDTFRDAASVFQTAWPSFSFRDVLMPYYNPHVFAIIDHKDLMPFVWRFTVLSKRVLAALGSRVLG